MKVKHIKEALYGLDDNEPVMITFFLKSHADAIPEENDEQPLSNNEWLKAVEKYMSNDHIDQITCEGYVEIIRSIIDERVKK